MHLVTKSINTDLIFAHEPAGSHVQPLFCIILALARRSAKEAVGCSSMEVILSLCKGPEYTDTWWQKNKLWSILHVQLMQQAICISQCFTIKAMQQINHRQYEGKNKQRVAWFTICIYWCIFYFSPLDVTIQWYFVWVDFWNIKCSNKHHTNFWVIAKQSFKSQHFVADTRTN